MARTPSPRRPSPTALASHPIVPAPADLVLADLSNGPVPGRPTAVGTIGRPSAPPTRLPQPPAAARQKAGVAAPSPPPRAFSSAAATHPLITVLVAQAMAKAVAAARAAGREGDEGLPASTTVVRLLVARALSRAAAAELGAALGPPHLCRVARDKQAAVVASSRATRTPLPAPVPARPAQVGEAVTESLEAALGPPRLSRLQREAAEWAAVPRRPAKWVR